VLDASLGIGWGLGASSVGWSLWLVLVSPPGAGYVAAEVVLALALASSYFLTRRRFPDPAPLPPRAGTSRGRRLRLALSVCLALVIASSLVAFVVQRSAQPHGLPDAVGIWNLRARSLFRCGEHWRDAFTPVVAGADYPLLVPGAVARCWTYLGHEETLGPAVLGLLFTLAAAGVLGAVVGLLRGPTQGLLAALVLLGSRMFLRAGLAQLADVPLAFFVLATVGLLCLHDQHGAKDRGCLALAGIMAGFAAWTKNEGQLFLACLLPARIVTRGLTLGWKEGAREMLPLVLGLFPALLLLIAFKANVAPPNVNVAAGRGFVSGLASQATLSQVADPSRYLTIASAYGRALLAIGPWAIVPLTGAFLLLGRVPRGARPPAALPLVVLTLMLLGYFVVYLIVPHDLNFYLDTSLHRLYMHVWPLALLWYFLVVATPEEAAARRSAPEVKAA
jgi:hypothetical protein